MMQVGADLTMASPSRLRSILVIIHIPLFLALSDCQTTPFDEFGGVTVPDITPNIAANSRKRYTTTIRLEKISQAVEFVPNSFADAAEEFYSNALGGFIAVENVQSSTISNSIIEATYDALYSFSILNTSVSGENDEIRNAIGTIESVRNGLNSVPGILRFYSVVDDEESFFFDGSSLCEFASCNGTYRTCIETTDGINVNCVSECKNGYCGEDGICFHADSFVAPTCRCKSLNDLWIIGARCETKFPLWLVVLLSVVGFIIILVVVIIVVICVMRKRKEKGRKEELLNSMPTSFENRAVANDQIRTTATAPRTNVSSLPNIPSTLTREDSFETVTSSEYPPSEYRPRSHADRRSHASSTHTSRDHRHNGHHRRHGHSNHHRRRPTEETRRRSENGGRERSPFATEVQRQPPESDSSSSESDTKDLKNLSFYEVEVNDLDLETDAASSIGTPSGTKASPIRWLPPKTAQPRPGWVPSLGPMMYELPTAKKDNTTESLPRRREGGTDV